MVRPGDTRDGAAPPPGLRNGAPLLAAPPRPAARGARQRDAGSARLTPACCASVPERARLVP